VHPLGSFCSSVTVAVVCRLRQSSELICPDFGISSFFLIQRPIERDADFAHVWSFVNLIFFNPTFSSILAWFVPFSGGFFPFFCDDGNFCDPNNLDEIVNFCFLPGSTLLLEVGSLRWLSFRRPLGMSSVSDWRKGCDSCPVPPFSWLVLIFLRLDFFEGG